MYIYIYMWSLSFDGIYLEDSSRVTLGSMQVYFCESSGWAAGLDMHQTGNIYFWNTYTDEVISGCARTLRLASILVLFWPRMPTRVRLPGTHRQSWTSMSLYHVLLSLAWAPRRLRSKILNRSWMSQCSLTCCAQILTAVPKDLLKHKTRKESK